MQPRQRLLPESAILFVLFVTIAVIVAIGAFSFVTTRAHEAADVELRRARQVTNSTTELLSALKDAETAQRGFLIAGGENYLIPYNVAIANLPGIRNRLRAVLEGEPQTQAQRSNLPELETLVDSRIFELGSTIDIRRTAGFDAARQVV